VSQELMSTTTPKALALSTEARAAMMEAFAENVSMGAISEFDLPRIKVVSGAALWLIPGLERQETADRIEVIILLKRNARVYFAIKDGGNQAPDCSSTNCKIGVGTPGGECARCPFARFGSAIDGGKGQACKEVIQMFFLRMAAIFPEIVTLPPTSLSAARQFFVRASTQGLVYHRVIVSIELQEAKNAANQVYGKARINMVRRLTEDEVAGIAEFRGMAQQIAGDVETAAAGPE